DQGELDVAYLARLAQDLRRHADLADVVNDRSQTAASPAASGEPLKIGATLPLTGAFAETGKWVEKGYRYWAEELNSKGGLLGRKVELTIYDDGSSAEKAVNLLERAITVDKVDLVAGGYPGTSAAAQMPLAERFKKVYVSMGGHMASFKQGYKYSFGGPPLMGQWWYEGIWQWLATVPADQRPKKAAAITMNNPIGLAVKDSMYDGLKRLGIELVVDEMYDLPLADAAPLVAKAKASGAELFLANGSFADGVQTIRALKTLDYNPKIVIQGIGTLVPGWTTELGDDGNYVFSGTAMHDKLPFPGVADLNKVAKEKFNLPSAPQYFLFGYAWMETLQKGVEGARSLDQDVIANYLRTHEIDTIGGKFKFDERGLPAPYSYATQVINGRPELIWPGAVKTTNPVYPKPAWKK
ncbi:MAG: amino acid ABC transporter substrate-binding protein, partial [Dehalococcoidales bacterium]|nr:amino acid ABC transporter substrate-binding protein [Dehalococcoidales bacterium]